MQVQQHGFHSQLKEQRMATQVRTFRLSILLEAPLKHLRGYKFEARLVRVITTALNPDKVKDTFFQQTIEQPKIPHEYISGYEWREMKPGELVPMSS
jgi:hypothetical protein